MGVGSLYSACNGVPTPTALLDVAKNAVFERGLILSERHLVERRDGRRNITTIHGDVHAMTEFVELVLTTK